MTTQPPADGIGKIVAFLLGEADLDGHWFGDETDLPLVAGRPARYWWRTPLREAFAAITTPEPDASLDDELARLRKVEDRLRAIQCAATPQPATPPREVTDHEGRPLTYWGGHPTPAATDGRESATPADAGGDAIAWFDDVLGRLRGQLRTSDAAFDWKIVRDYHAELCRVRHAIAALRTRTPSPEYEPVLCKTCGHPTMHMGPICYACSHSEQGGGGHG